jgi:hypothetical protein
MGSGMLRWLAGIGFFDVFDFVTDDLYDWWSPATGATVESTRAWHSKLLQSYLSAKAINKPLVPILSPRLAGIGADPVPNDAFGHQVAHVQSLLMSGDVASVLLWDPQPSQPFPATLSANYQILANTFPPLVVQ